MIGVASGFTAPDQADNAGTRMAASLGLFAGHAAALHLTSTAAWSQLAAPRIARPGEWPADWSGGDVPGCGRWRVLIDGRIDNADEIADALRLPRIGSGARLYGEALRHWGDEADARLIGCYAAICEDEGGSLRLARSPWDAPSLFWARHGGVLYACSTPRPMFAAGFPKRLKSAQLAEALFWIENPEGGTWYEGLHAVPQGSVVRLAATGCPSARQWYDPHAIAPVRLVNDDAYVEAANALLADAVRAALAPVRKPAILLSGGLDSALVADEMLAQTAPDGRLRSYTFTPAAAFAGSVGAAHYSDERPAVDAFAACHPRLDATFCDNQGRDFDALAEQLFLAGGTGRPSLAITAPYHGPALAAAADGCDWLFDASFGNAGLSQDGRWAYGEFLRQGRWGELWRLAREEPGDTRPIWRRLAARSLLSQLPHPLRVLVRAIAHGRAPPVNAAVSFLRGEVREALALDDLAERLGQMRRGEWQYDRRAWLRRTWAMQDVGTEQHHATGQVYGLRRRDVMAYRPLVEFCLGLPTTQIVRRGEQRWLARRMAAGRMPTAQAWNRRYGRHNADWHSRLTARLPELSAECQRIADTPELARLIDTDAMWRTLAEWPVTMPTDQAEVTRCFHALTGAILVARFWRFASGSNR